MNIVKTDKKLYVVVVTCDNVTLKDTLKNRILKSMHEEDPEATVVFTDTVGAYAFNVHVVRSRVVTENTVLTVSKVNSVIDVLLELPKFDVLPQDSVAAYLTVNAEQITDQIFSGF